MKEPWNHSDGDGFQSCGFPFARDGSLITVELQKEGTRDGPLG